MKSAAIRTMHGLIDSMSMRSSHIAAMKLEKSIPNDELEDDLLIFANEPAEIDRVTRSIDYLGNTGNLSSADLEKMTRDLLSPNFYGSFSELAVYDWFQRHDAEFTPQIKMTAADVLNPNGSDLDGQFKNVDVAFDIKAMGFQTYVKEQFRKKVQRQVSDGRVVIDGAEDNSVKDIERDAFGQIAKVAADLSTTGITRIPSLNWTIRLEKRNVSIAEGLVNPYRMAEENRYYPFKTGRQFAKNRPFLLVFGFSPRQNLLLSVNFDDSTSVVLRSLCRRAFMQVVNETAPLTKFDRKAEPVTVGDASKLLSGVLFVNFSDDHAWLFLNPRATHKLSRDKVEAIFDFRRPTEMLIDDFAYDDY